MSDERVIHWLFLRRGEAGRRVLAVAKVIAVAPFLVYGVLLPAGSGILVTQWAFATRILALEDKVAVHRLSGLKDTVREPLLELDDAKLLALARAMTEPELESLSRYLTGLTRPAAERVLNAIALSPTKLQLLVAPGVRDAVLASRDQSAAVGVVVRSDPVFDFISLAIPKRSSTLAKWVPLVPPPAGFE